MLLPVDRPVAAARKKYLLMADAFVISGALFMVSMGSLGLVFREPSTASELLSQLALMLSLAGGPLAAWVLHGNRVRWVTIAGLVLGLVLGPVVVGLGFGAVFVLARFLVDPVIRSLFDGLPEGPWGLVALAALATVAFLGSSLFAAARDLGSRSTPPRRRLGVIRLGLTLLIVVVIVASVVVGGEGAEVGMVMVPLAAGGAATAWAIAWLEGRQART